MQHICDTVLQVFPCLHDSIHIDIFLDLIYNGCAVHCSHSGITLIHIYKTDKTQDADHKAEIKASACLFFLLFCTVVKVVIDPAVPWMDGRNIPPLIIQPACLAEKFSAARFRIIHDRPSFLHAAAFLPFPDSCYLTQSQYIQQ